MFVDIIVEASVSWAFGTREAVSCKEKDQRHVQGAFRARYSFLKKRQTQAPAGTSRHGVIFICDF